MVRLLRGSSPAVSSSHLAGSNKSNHPLDHLLSESSLRFSRLTSGRLRPGLVPTGVRTPPFRADMPRGRSARGLWPATSRQARAIAEFSRVGRCGRVGRPEPPARRLASARLAETTNRRRTRPRIHGRLRLRIRARLRLRLEPQDGRKHRDASVNSSDRRRASADVRFGKSLACRSDESLEQPCVGTAQSRPDRATPPCNPDNPRGFPSSANGSSTPGTTLGLRRDPWRPTDSRLRDCRNRPTCPDRWVQLAPKCAGASFPSDRPARAGSDWRCVAPRRCVRKKPVD